MKKQELVTNADSKGTILDALGTNYKSYPNSGILQYREPRFSPSTSLKIIENDPTVKGAVITLVDKTLEAGWRIEGRDKKSRQKDAEKKLKELRFNPVLRKALFNIFLYNNAYIENVKSETKGVKDINLLETTKVRISSEDNGDVLDYYMVDNDNIRWKPDQVTHIKLNEFTTNVYADSDMKVLYETVLIKDYIRQWLSWFFGTNQMRPVFNSKTKMTPQKVSEFVSWMKACEKDLKKPFFFEGDVVVQSLMSFAKEGATIQQMLEWCDNQILQVLQVPPIQMGMPDQSGRSNSVEQNNALNTRIKNVQMILEDIMSYDLFPKIGFEKIDFKFGSMDFAMTARIMDTVQVMKNAQFTDEAIQEFLVSQGVLFDTTQVFKDPVEEAKKMQDATMTNKDVGTGNEGMIGNKSADGAPSRQRQSSQELSKANKTSQKKVEAASEKFNQFPYVYEVKDDV